MKEAWGCSYDHKKHTWVCRRGDKQDLIKEDVLVPPVCQQCPRIVEMLNLALTLKTWNLQMDA